ncbi:MAG: ankyrin repeat domain-containing protein [Kistimonas sp.]|nr:ankyrin repeat domain-containing protein [Kistimonas sp.]
MDAMTHSRKYHASYCPDPGRLQAKIKRLEKAGCDPSPAKVKDAQKGLPLPESRFAGFNVGVSTGSAASRGRVLKACVQDSNKPAFVVRLSDFTCYSPEEDRLPESAGVPSSTGRADKKAWLVLSQSELLQQLMRFDGICRRVHAGPGRPLDMLSDDPLPFVLKAQLLDKNWRHFGERESICVRFLVRACEEKNLPVACKIMQGLQLAQQRGLLDEDALYSSNGGLLHSPAFYESSSRWRRWLLGSGVFDPSRLSCQHRGFTPLFGAMGYSAACVEDLLRAGADPNAGDSEGLPPLGLCVSPWTTDKVAKLNRLLELSSPGRIDPGLTGCGAKPTRLAAESAVDAEVKVPGRLDVDRVFDVSRDASYCFTGSALAAASFCFLAETGYPVEVISVLARRGASLLVVDSAGKTVDWTDDSDQWVRQLRRDFSLSRSDERVEQLRNALAVGGMHRGRAGHEPPPSQYTCHLL